MQCIVWNTWGPIESGAQYAFDWSESTVAMFANWGTIMFLLAVVPLSKMVEVRASVDTLTFSEKTITYRLTLRTLRGGPVGILCFFFTCDF